MDWYRIDGSFRIDCGGSSAVAGMCLGGRPEATVSDSALVGAEVGGRAHVDDSWIEIQDSTTEVLKGL